MNYNNSERYMVEGQGVMEPKMEVSCIIKNNENKNKNVKG